MTNLIQRFPHNEVGRDFVCGDIHGHFFKLEQKLINVNFDETKDRLFLLGDLIDRGPNSDHVLEWLNKPFVYSIMGNHELLCLWCNTCDPSHSEAKKQWTEIWFKERNGGRWWAHLPYDQKKLCIEKFNQLPLVIEIMVGEKKIGLIHADSSFEDWDDIIEDISNLPENKDTWERNPLVSMLLWDDFKITHRDWFLQGNSYVMNIDHIYHGHSIVSDPITIGNVTYIDTGPNKPSGKLTLINLTELYS